MAVSASGGLRRHIDRWLFRIRSPEPAPIVLGQRRIFVLPTRAGAAFAAALLVMLVASINYSLGLGFALVFLLAGVGFASILHAFRNLLDLALRPGRVEPVFSGETARFRLLVGNPRNLRRPALRLLARGEICRFDLGPGETSEVVLPCTTRRRGSMPLGRVVLETVYPLGFIRAWSVFVPDMECLVYPAPEQNPPPLPDSFSDDTGQRAGQTGDDDFAGLRARQLADSPRHVAWKVVARGGPMLTKQFSGLEGGKGELDWDELPPGLDVEARLSRLAAWVLMAEGRGVPFRLRLPSGTSPVGSGPQHVADCLKRLTLFAAGDADHG